MELSAPVSQSLQKLGQSTIVSDKSFEEILILAISELKDTPHVSKSKDLEELAKYGMKDAVSTLFLEATKNNLSSITLSSILEDLEWSQDRCNKIKSNYEDVNNILRSDLSSLTQFLPHIVDIDWKLEHEVMNSAMGVERSGTRYLVTMYFDKESEPDFLTFSLSLDQLTHLVNTLRRATRCLQKYAVSS